MNMEITVLYLLDNLCGTICSREYQTSRFILFHRLLVEATGVRFILTFPLSKILKSPLGDYCDVVNIMTSSALCTNREPR
jgi:hypothetical protein